MAANNKKKSRSKGGSAQKAAVKKAPVAKAKTPAKTSTPAPKTKTSTAPAKKSETATATRDPAIEIAKRVELFEKLTSVQKDGKWLDLHALKEAWTQFQWPQRLAFVIRERAMAGGLPCTALEATQQGLLCSLSEPPCDEDVTRWVQKLNQAADRQAPKTTTGAVGQTDGKVTTEDEDEKVIRVATEHNQSRYGTMAKSGVSAKVIQETKRLLADKDSGLVEFCDRDHLANILTQMIADMPKSEAALSLPKEMQELADFSELGKITIWAFLAKLEACLAMGEARKAHGAERANYATVAQRISHIVAKERLFFAVDRAKWIKLHRQAEKEAAAVANGLTGMSTAKSGNDSGSGNNRKRRKDKNTCHRCDESGHKFADCEGACYVCHAEKGHKGKCRNKKY